MLKVNHSLLLFQCSFLSRVGYFPQSAIRGRRLHVACCRLLQCHFSRTSEWDVGCGGQRVGCRLSERGRGWLWGRGSGNGAACQVDQKHRQQVRRLVGLREVEEVEKPESQSRTTGAQTQGRGRAFSDDDDDAGGGLPALGVAINDLCVCQHHMTGPDPLNHRATHGATRLRIPTNASFPGREGSIQVIVQFGSVQ